ncbi:MAG TPA: nuclear transport factor 2 family protein [Pyrinomonadaceae bacterium]|nr:nuclear transport factor 2 family protein [Pyrinomonadaceae bacterium]
MPRICSLWKFAVLTVYVLAFLAGCSRSSATQTQPGPEEQNRQVVLAFYDQGLVNLQPRAAFERYASEDFVEHKPDVAEGTREATIAFLEGLIKEVPKPTWKVIRTVAEGDLVFLHASFTPADGAPPYAVADVFRLHEGKIVEHWDVVAPPVKQPLNPHSRF